jgi:tetratricopeptide (TPR) repeat protein
MRWAAAWAVMMLVGLSALWAKDDVKAEPKEREKSKVAEEVDALIAAYQKAGSDFNQNIQEKLKNAKTDQERVKIYQSRADHPKPDETMDKLWDLLEKNPNDKEASRTALQWLLNNCGYDEKGQKGRDRVLDMLIKHHADDPKIGPMLHRLGYAMSPKTEELFRAVMAKNPAKDAKGSACLNLGKYLKGVSEAVQHLKESPEDGKRAESVLGKEAVLKLMDADPDKLAKEAEALFEEAAAKYGDVVLYKNPSTMKDVIIADQVVGELFEIRNLAIGKTAPDIVGDDLDGKPFKLSDYRGKVVVIDFWGNW